jgi:hypothetical protein
MNRFVLRQQAFDTWIRSSNSKFLKLVDTESKGRAMLASRKIEPKTMILREQPLISTPQLFDLKFIRCSHCSQTISNKSNGKDNSTIESMTNWNFCSDYCKTNAKQQYWEILKDLDVKTLFDVCSTKRKLYPFMALRLYGLILQDVDIRLFFLKKKNFFLSFIFSFYLIFLLIFVC